MSAAAIPAFGANPLDNIPIPPTLGAGPVPGPAPLSKPSVFEAVHNTLLPQRSKGVRYLLEVIEYVIKIAGCIFPIVAVFYKLVEACSMARSLIGAWQPLGTIKYFRDYRNSKDATWYQAVSMSLIGVISVLSTLRFLEKFDLATLGRITATLGKVPVVGLVFSVLTFAINSFSLTHDYVTSKTKAEELRECELSLEMWRTRRAALNTYKVAQTEGNWTALIHAGENQQRHLRQMSNARLETLPPGETREQARYFYRLENGNRWDLLVNNETRGLEYLILQTRENASTPLNEHKVNKLELLDDKIRYLEAKTQAVKANIDLYYDKAFFRVIGCIGEIAVAVFTVAGLAGIAFFSLTGPFMLVLGLSVAGIGLYQVFYDYHNPVADMPRKPEKFELDSRGTLRDAGFILRRNYSQRALRNRTRTAAELTEALRKAHELESIENADETNAARNSRSTTPYSRQVDTTVQPAQFSPMKLTNYAKQASLARLADASAEEAAVDADTLQSFSST